MKTDDKLNPLERAMVKKATGRYSDTEIAALIFGARNHRLDPIEYLARCDEVRQELRDYRTAQAAAEEGR